MSAPEAKSDQIATPIVFLHIPKTAGQTVHNELARAIGADQVSPIRVYTQAPTEQYPPGFMLYSGHLDWTDLDSVPQPRFVFTVLRDPRERLASFYFYLLDKVQTLSKDELELPANTGMKAIAEKSVDDYFFDGPPMWQGFITDHYDNFYCRYFASRRIRAGRKLDELSHESLLSQAERGANSLDRIYMIDQLDRLEGELRDRFELNVKLTKTYHNAGNLPRSEKRWPKLIGLFENDTSPARIEKFVALDEQLIEKLQDK